jgi:3',5'-cyclic AMP phosphodiesterase CpdA
MRIVHFSDLHFASLTRYGSALVDKRLLGLLNYALRRRRQFDRTVLPRAIDRIRRLAPDLVVFTGDLTCTGSPEEFAAGVRALGPLLRATALPFYYVPGNHDVYVRNSRCAEAFAEAFRVLNRGREATDLPFTVRHGPLSFLFLHQAFPCNPFLSSGRMAPEARSAVESWLDTPRERGEKRVLVGHFPLRMADGRPLGRRRHLADSEWLYAALQKARVDVSLCGHIHTPFCRTEPSGSLEVCAGSLPSARCFSVLQYFPDSGVFSQYWEDLSDSPAAPVEAAPDLVYCPRVP